MTEISIKIKGLKQTGSKAGKKKKGKKVMAKPKTKTESYLEKLKGREYSYNTSPFYDYKTGLQPTYIYRQQTIPQLQQDSKHNELIKYLEDIKKSDRELQTLKFRNTDPPPIPYFPKTTSSIIAKDITESEALKEELDEVKKEQNRYLELIKEIEKMDGKISYNNTQYKNAIEREIERAKQNKPLVYRNKSELSSDEYLERIENFRMGIAEKELEIYNLKRNLGIK